MAYIGSPASKFTIPVTMGADRLFTVNRVDKSTDPPTPADWDAQLSIAVVVDKTAPPVTVEAAVAADQATFLLPASLCDQVKSSTAWRMFMVTPYNGGTLTTPLAVGNFERDDGGGEL